jgi:diguanylate cyclase
MKLRFDRKDLSQVASLRVLDPSVATVRTIGYITAYFYLFGGAAALSSTFLLGWTPQANPTVIRGIGVFAIFVSALLLAFGSRLPRWFFHVLVFGGNLLITGIVWSSGSSSAALAASSIYTYVLIDSVIYFAWMGMITQLAACGITATIALHHTHVQAAEILLVGFAGVAVATCVAWLARTTSIAQLDQLTKLPNRRGFEARMQEALNMLNREGDQLSLIFLDIDHFKTVNDNDGHGAGDKVLIGCAEAWRTHLNGRGILGRFGGDEFVVMLPDIGLGRASDIADELRGMVPDRVTISAGVTVHQPGDTLSTLTGRADAALYEAKRASRDQTVAFGDPSRSASEIERAIANNEMFLEFQPICDAATREPLGFEALIRWSHPKKGVIPPVRFIPQAERTGAIHALGAWTLHEACRLAAASALHDERISFSVNVSIPELLHAGYVNRVQDALVDHELEPQQLTVEVTEAVFDDQGPQVINSLLALHDRGVRIAIDDFGSGYSSLRWLEQFPVDTLKVDQAFVSGITSPDQSSPVLEGIIRLGRTLGMEVVIEGVETEVQAQVLLAAGADAMQGYLFGPPARPVNERLPSTTSRRRASVNATDEIVLKRATLPQASTHTVSSGLSEQELLS